MLQDTIERFFVDNLYADIERGLFLVRGENVLLLGEIVCSTNVSTEMSEADTYVGPGQRRLRPTSIRIGACGEGVRNEERTR